MHCVRGSHGGHGDGNSAKSRPEVTFAVPVLMLRIFSKHFANVVARTTTSRGIKVMTNPKCFKVMTGHKAECSKCGGMIGTFIPEVPGVAVHMSHGKP